MPVKIFYYFISYFFVSLILSLLLVPLIEPLAFKLGAVDSGAGRRAHKGVIPRLGGIGIFLAFIIPFGFSLTRGQWDSSHHKMLGVIIASTIVLLIGVYDDLKGARIRNKLLAEFAAAAVIYAWGIRIDAISNPFGNPIDLGLLSLPVTILWIVIVTNAINLIDGLDGLAAGTGILISATFFLLVGNQFHLQLAYVILAGSLLGFLRYNFPPATIFMGDSGSLFLGFLLGATSIISSHKATAFVTIMIPVIAFGLPLMDMFYAVVRRYYRGMPLGEADKEHIHHKLLEKGLSKKKVLFLLYSVNIAIMLGVLLLVRKQWNMDILGLVLLVVVAVVGLRSLGYVRFIPFVKNMFRNYDIGKKTKYCNYVIQKFRNRAAESGSFEELQEHLTELMEQYDFISVEINLDVPSVENPVYLFKNGSEQVGSMKLSFPILGALNNRLGEVSIVKRVSDEHFLCAADMVRAVSGEVSKFIERSSIQA